MPLNASGGAVRTDYAYASTTASELPALTARRACGGPQQLACATGAGEISATPTDNGFILAAADGSVAPATFTLPAGYAVGASCCAPGCCQ